MAKYFCLPIIFSLILLFTENVGASSNIVINEFLANPAGSENDDEWVELYNQSEADIDVNDWSLCDAGSHILKISSENTNESTQVKSKEWLVVFRQGSSFSLNNTGDEVISLFNSSDCSGTAIDDISYSGAVEEKTWGRIPDGIGDFQKNLKKSPGSTNIEPEPSPEPQKDSSTSEESKSEPKSTSSPSSTKKSATQKSTTTTKSPSPILGKKSQVLPKLLPSETPSPSPNLDQLDQIEGSSSKIKTAGILTGSGVILIGASITFYVWYYKVKGKKDPSQKEPEIEDNP